MIPTSKKLDKIAKIFTIAAKNKKDHKGFLTDILSPGEIDDIFDRISIFEELLKNKPQREVSGKLKVSIAKVTRAAHVLKYGSHVLKKLL